MCNLNSLIVKIMQFLDRETFKGIKYFYENINANPIRSIHSLAEEATKNYNEARKKVADFINAEPENATKSAPINDIKEITRLAHEQGSLVLIDAAQSVPNIHSILKTLAQILLHFPAIKCSLLDLH